MAKLQLRKKGKSRQATITIPIQLVDALGWENKDDIDVKLLSKINLEEMQEPQIKVVLIKR